VKAKQDRTVLLRVRDLRIAAFTGLITGLVTAAGWITFKCLPTIMKP
jgi:hypothetical protein